MPGPLDSDTVDRLWRRVPYLAGFSAIVLILAFAAGVRFAGSPSDPVAGDSTTTSATDAVATSAPAAASTTAATPAASTTTTAPGPAYGGVADVGAVGTPDSLNPYLITGNDQSLEVFRPLMWASAMQTDMQTLEPRPGVVEETPTLGNGGLTINPDGTMTVRYTIRSDAVWEDGNPVVFDDFLRTYEVITRASGINPDIRDRYDVVIVGSVEGEGREVSFTVERPTLAFVDLFDVLLPAHQVEVAGFESAWDDQLWMSAGPFRFDSWDGTVAGFVANPAAGLTDEDGRPLPYLDGITVRFYPTDAEAVAELEAGTIDVAGPLEDRSLVERLDDDPIVVVDVRHGPLWQHLTFQFDDGRFAINPESAIDNVALRREFARLIDRTAIAEAAQGRFAQPVDSMVAFSWPAADTDAWSVYEAEDPTNCCGGVTIALTTSAADEQRAEIAAQVVERLQAAGIGIDVNFEELGRMFQQYVIPGDFEVALWSWQSTPGPAGAASDLVNLYATRYPQGNNFSRFADRDELTDAELEFLDLIEGLDAVLSYDDLRERVTRIEGILASEVVVIPLFAELNVGAYRVETIAGFRHATPEGGVTSSAAQWWHRDS